MHGDRMTTNDIVSLVGLSSILVAAGLFLNDFFGNYAARLRDLRRQGIGTLATLYKKRPGNADSGAALCRTSGPGLPALAAGKKRPDPGTRSFSVW